MKKLLLAIALIGFIAVSSYAASALLKTNSEIELCEDEKCKKSCKKDCKKGDKKSCKKSCNKGEKKSCNKGEKKACCSKTAKTKKD